MITTEDAMPWVGLYVAGATLACTLAMAADAFQGFRQWKLWFPNKFFVLSYELSDFTDISKPIKTHIQVANRERMNVKTGETIKISPSIKIPNSLHVPSLSHKLLSISHVTKELNCSVLMHPIFCLLHDIKTRRIIGRCTERDGLYYVDEVVQSSTVMLAHGTTEREAWL
nr:putative ribonuclease H-like domain-containing protein [Tanacetum cinerariifolium]